MSALLHLPVELLQRIICQLCSHCTETYSSNEKLLGKALEALCLTSLLLRSIAQPILFHHIQGNRLFNVIKTLKQRPDLAACVKQYTQASHFRFFAESTDEPEFSFIRTLARELLLGGTADQDPDAMNNVPWDQGLLIQIVLALTPNIETLKILVDNSFNEITRFDGLSGRFKSLGGVGLPNLRHVQFGTDWLWGFDLSSPVVGVILQSSPNLQQLIFRHCKASWKNIEEVSNITAQYPDLSQVRTLEFQNCAFEDDETSVFFLNQMAKMCPLLENFRLKSAKMYLSGHLRFHLAAPRVLKGLTSQRVLLKCLDINLVESCLEIDMDPRATFVDLEGLNLFTNLETLKLGEESFCLHRRNPYLTSSTCLSASVPESIHTLVVRLVIDSLAWKDLAELAVQVKAGRFPNLKRVNVYAISGMLRGRGREERLSKLRNQIQENTSQLHEVYGKTQVHLFVGEQEGTSNEGEDNVLGSCMMP